MTFLDDLNPKQREAVLYVDGPSLIIAGAGSGKTRVLTYKIAYLLTLGIPASKILALTFTNKAAREMKERIGNLVGEDIARHLWMGTFHAIFTRILRHEITYLPTYTKDFSIYDSTDSKNVIKHILSDWDLDEKHYKVPVLQSRISMAKNRLQSPKAYANDKTCTETDHYAHIPRTADIYNEYVQRLRNANAMDFDDLLVNMYILLQTNPDILQKYQEWFDFILVDEYQDTNFAQYAIIRELTKLKNKLCVVGDDAQSIYSFRGANIQNILAFQSDNTQARLFRLERNYRSTQNIVNAANSLISKNKGQIPKNVYSEKEVGDKILVSSHGCDRNEASFIVKTIARIHRTEHTSYEEIAVMYRTNAQSRVIEDAMRKASIPYRIYGSIAFYQRKEVKDAIAYMKLIFNPCDEEALLRTINTPTRGIGDTTIKKLIAYAHDNNLSPFAVASDPYNTGIEVSTATKDKLCRFAAMITEWHDQAESVDAYDLATDILKRSGLMLDAEKDKTEEGINRLENLRELLNGIHEFREEGLRNGETFVTLSDFLSEVSLQTDQDQIQLDNLPHVTLLTIHAAKGLEYEVVFLPGLEDGLFPSSYIETAAEEEEERRLLYVGITRAKRLCYISSAQTRFRNGQSTISTPSRFIKDIDSQYILREIKQISPYTSWKGNTIPSQPQYTFGQNHPIKLPSATQNERGKHLKRLSKKQATSDKEAINPPYPIGSRVRHSIFGDGTILEAFKENGSNRIIISFDKLGTKTMLLDYIKLEYLG